MQRIIWRSWVVRSGRNGIDGLDQDWVDDDASSAVTTRRPIGLCAGGGSLYFSHHFSASYLFAGGTLFTRRRLERRFVKLAAASG